MSLVTLGDPSGLIAMLILNKNNLLMRIAIPLICVTVVICIVLLSFGRQPSKSTNHEITADITPESNSGRNERSEAFDTLICTVVSGSSDLQVVLSKLTQMNVGFVAIDEGLATRLFINDNSEAEVTQELLSLLESSRVSPVNLELYNQH